MNSFQKVFIILSCTLTLLLTSCDQSTTEANTGTISSEQCSAMLPICVNKCCPEKPANDTVVDHDIFVLANNPQTKFADWVAYKVVMSKLSPTQVQRRVAYSILNG